VTLPSAPRSRVLGQIALLTGRLSAARRELSVARQLGTSDGAQTADPAAVASYLGLLSMVEGTSSRQSTCASMRRSPDRRPR
jgi:hypothetical protein